MAESYSIDGTDISTLMTHVQTLDGLIGTPPMLQRDYVIPGRTGSVAAKPWAGARPLTFGGIVTGATRIAYQGNLRSLAELCFNGGDTVTITRVIDLPADETLSVVGTARYVGGLESVNELAPNVGRVAIEFSLISGFFYASDYADSGVKSTSTFTIDAPGEAPTSEVKVQFSGGTGAQKLTNTTTGDYVQYTGATSTAVELNSATFTATQGATNVVSGVEAGTASYYWMRLNPGVNSFTRTGNGDVQVFYKAAYL